jgi:hypothetical protein
MHEDNILDFTKVDISWEQMNVNSDAHDLKKSTQHIVTVHDVTGGNHQSQNSKKKTWKECKLLQYIP